MFRGSVKVTGYPLLRQFPLHFPCCASQCVITFQLESTTHSQCVSVVLVVQHTTRMRRIIKSSCGLPGSAIFYHSISHTARFSSGRGGGELLNKKWVFRDSLQLWYEIFHILRIIQCSIITNVREASRKVSLIIVRFYPFQRRIKSHLPFAGIIRSSPYSSR